MFTLERPWNIYQKKLDSLFKNDPNVSVSGVFEDDDDSKLTVTVKGADKAFAIKSVLNGRAEFGNIVLKIEVVDENGGDPTPINATPEALLGLAFKGNPLFCRLHQYTDAPILERIIFCIFAKEIIQFYNDNIMDYDGNYNAVTADVVCEVCVPDIYGKTISYCTKSDREA